MEYAKKCCLLYHGLRITELKELAYQYAVKVQADYPESWAKDGMAGKHWYYSFMKRHRVLSLRTPEQTSINRVKSFTQENVDLFMKNLGDAMTATNYDEDRIWNMDEAGFSCVPNKVGKVIGIRGMKKIGQLSSAERGKLMTMALSVNAAGRSMPPMFVFPGKNMQTVNMDNKPPGSIGVANDSGWMKEPEFATYMRHFIQHSHSSLESPNLLILDGHTSHLSIEALDLAAENGVTLLTLPPHCSHKLQPLDVSIFGPVRTYYAKFCSDWGKTHGTEPILMRHLVGLVSQTLDLALTPANIKAGFRASGICPYNSCIFTEADFIQAQISGENQAVVLEEEDPEDENNPRQIVIGVAPEVGAESEVSTSEAPSVSTSVSRSTSLSSLLDNIGPLQTPPPKSTQQKKRGPKPTKSTILTSPENLANLKEKRAKRDAAKEKTEKKKAEKANKAKASTSTGKATTRAAASTSAPKPAKRQKRSSSSEDLDFCIICSQFLPRNMINTVECIKKCGIVVHKRCAKANAARFVCEHCDEDLDEISDEVEEPEDDE